MAPNDTASLDDIFQEITTATKPAVLSQFLRTSIPKEARDLILSAPLSSGQDPLTLLNPSVNTLGVLYILSARLSVSNAPPPSWAGIVDFCRHFDVPQARLAPERVTQFAQGIMEYANRSGNPQWSLEPLFHLVTKFPEDTSILTPLHPLFVLQCVSTRHFSQALPVITVPISSISTHLTPDITYNDNLIYHYLAGVAFSALGKWDEAEEAFEICVTSPGTAPAALQMEALKRLRIGQLISKGKIEGLPKYTHPTLIRAFKQTPYQSFIYAYPNKPATLSELLEKEASTFSTDQMLGLMKLAFSYAPRWSLKKLTATYVTLGLTEIGKAIGIQQDEEVKSLVLSMIESGQISALISPSGTVTFSDPQPTFTKEQVDTALRDAQEQGAMLVQLEMETARSRDYLQKALKPNKDEWSGGGSMMEGAEGLMQFGPGSSTGAWQEESVFA